MCDSLRNKEPGRSFEGLDAYDKWFPREIKYVSGQ